MAGLAATLVFAVTGQGPRVQAPDERPNVLLIVTDDQNVDPASYEVMPKTMALFRRGGTNFANAVATTPTCCPSRASILSGLYAHNHGVLNNAEGADFDSERSIQRELDVLGYQTALVGKFLNSWHIEEAPPYWDRFAMLNGRASAPGQYDYVAPLWNVDGSVAEIPGYYATYMKQRSLEMLDSFEAEDVAPWMMLVAPYAPHEPATVGAAYKGVDVPEWTPPVKERNRADKPAYIQAQAYDLGETRRIRARQLRSLMTVDDLVGEIFERIDSLGEENTIAFFVSDNGYMWGDHRLRAKSFPYESSVRIPLLVRWPGHITEGVERVRLVANIDIAPTIYRLLSHSSSYEVDGRPLIGPAHRRGQVLIEYAKHSPDSPWEGYAGAWHPTWSYVELDTGEREYYGPDDPNQLTNLLGNDDISDDPDTTALEAWLDEARRCTGAECP